MEYIKLEFDEAGLLWNLFKASRAETHKDDDISTTEDLDESLELLITEYSGGGSIGTQGERFLPAEIRRFLFPRQSRETLSSRSRTISE